MPFKSEKQRRLLWAKHPEIARRWAHEYPGQKNLPMYANKDNKEEKPEKAAVFEGKTLTSLLTPYLNEIVSQQPKQANSMQKYIEIPHSDEPTYAGEERAQPQESKGDNKNAPGGRSLDEKMETSPLLQKLSAVLSRRFQQFLEDEKATAEARNSAYIPQNANLKQYPVATPTIPPPMGMTPPAPQPAPQPAAPAPQQQAANGPVGGGSNPAANPINAFGALSRSGVINGNAAFGAKNSPDSLKTAASPYEGLAKIMSMDFPPIPDPEDLDMDDDERMKTANDADKKPAKKKTPQQTTYEQMRPYAVGGALAGSLLAKALRAGYRAYESDYQQDYFGPDDDLHSDIPDMNNDVKYAAFEFGQKMASMAPIYGALAGAGLGAINNVVNKGDAQRVGNYLIGNGGPNMPYHSLDALGRNMAEGAVLGGGAGVGYDALKLLFGQKPKEEEAAPEEEEKAAGSKPGLWANIHAKRKRGEKPAKPGDKDYPEAKNWSRVTAESEKKSGSDTPCSCGCGDTVKTCKCGPECKCRKPGGSCYTGEKKAGTPAWQRSEGKNPEGGLNAKGRASYKAQTGGTLKAPVTESNPKGERDKRQNSFCSRMCGMKRVNTGADTAKDPDSRINKSLRKWNCKCGSALDFGKMAASRGLNEIPSDVGPDQIHDALFRFNQLRALARPSNETLKSRGLSRPGFQHEMRRIATSSQGKERFDLSKNAPNPNLRAAIAAAAGLAGTGALAYAGGGLNHVGAGLAGTGLAAGGAYLHGLHQRKNYHNTAKLLRDYGLLNPQTLRQAYPLLGDDYRIA